MELNKIHNLLTSTIKEDVMLGIDLLLEKDIETIKEFFSKKGRRHEISRVSSVEVYSINTSHDAGVSRCVYIELPEGYHIVHFQQQVRLKYPGSNLNTDYDILSVEEYIQGKHLNNKIS